MIYVVAKYSHRAKENGFDQMREEVASFKDPTRAEDYARTLTSTQAPMDEFGGKVYFMVDAFPDQAVSEPVPVIQKVVPAPFVRPSPFVPVKMTIKDAIEQAIRDAGGRANLDQIYVSVRRLKKLQSKTPNRSVRSDLYRGTESGRFVRNPDGTYSLGSKAATVTFKEYVSTPSSGIISGGRILSPYFPKEKELEDDFARNYREIFGRSTLYIPIKKLVGSKFKKVTDGLMLEIDDEGRPRFWIVEIELGSHDLESHIQVQVLAFLRALKDERSLRILTSAVYDYVESVASSEEDADFVTDLIDVPAGKARPRAFDAYRYLDRILHGDRGVIIVIDQAKQELPDIVDTISKIGQVKVVEFRSFKRNEEKVHMFSHVDMKQLS